MCNWNYPKCDLGNPVLAYNGYGNIPNSVYAVRVGLYVLLFRRPGPILQILQAHFLQPFGIHDFLSARLGVGHHSLHALPIRLYSFIHISFND